MFLEILFFIFLGILIGIFTGLIPGVHVNTLCITIIAFVPLLITSGISVYVVISFIISMAITSTLIDFIPSIFLGAPEDSTALSILPGHKMLMEGKGFEALFLTVIGGTFVTILFVFSTPILLFTLPFIYDKIKIYTHFILIFIVTLMLITERKKEKIFFSFLIFLFSGFLGIVTFNYPLIPQTLVFFPLFTGLFGISTLLISLRANTIIPPQEDFIWKFDKRIILPGTIKAFFSGLILGILPGVGAAQATVLAQELTTRRKDEKEFNKEFLLSIGGINTSVAIFSLLSLYAIQRPRSGAAVAVEKILNTFGMKFGFNELLLLIVCALISVGISAILALEIGRRSLKIIEKIPYNKISIFVIAFLISLVAILTNFYGLFILLLSTSIGLIAPLSNVKRSHAMGVLLLPVILFYAGIEIRI